MKTACVIMAAGLGKRMHSSLVKVLHTICGQSMIDYPVELALKQGFDPVVVVTGHQAEDLQVYLRGRFGERIRFALQDPPQGTGHAVLMAKKALSGFRGKLAILSSDVPLLSGRELGILKRAGRDAAVSS